MGRQNGHVGSVGMKLEHCCVPLCANNFRNLRNNLFGCKNYITVTLITTDNSFLFCFVFFLFLFCFSFVLFFLIERRSALG